MGKYLKVALILIGLLALVVTAGSFLVQPGSVVTVKTVLLVAAAALIGVATLLGGINDTVDLIRKLTGRDEEPKPVVKDSPGAMVADKIKVEGGYHFHEAARTPADRPIPMQRPPRAEHFTGRSTELTKLLADLQPGRIVTLVAPGGMGKTALAAEAAHHLPPERFPDGILFHSFYGQPDAALALEKIALAYGEEPRPTPRDAAQRALFNRQALLILDGAENADDLETVLQVRGRCGVLITSRSRQDAPAGFELVGALPPADAAELFRRWAGRHAGDNATVGSICELLGGLPLALRIAGRYLGQTELPAGSYLGWLQKSPLAALDQGARQRDSVKLVLRRSVERLSAEARCALTVAGYLALAPFRPESVAAALEMELDETGRWLGELINYGLAGRQDERYGLTHPLIHTYARENPCEEVPAEALDRLAGYFKDLLKEHSAEGASGFAQLDTERDHLLAVIRRCVEREQWRPAVSLVYAADTYLELRGCWTVRQETLGHGIQAAQSLSSRNNEGDLLNRLGSTLSALGQVERAVGYHKRALAIAQETGNRRDEAGSVGNLGVAFKDMGQFRCAIDYLGQALAIFQEIGDRHAEGQTLGNLAVAYNGLGRFEQAIEHLEQALTIAQEVDDLRGAGYRLGNLGSTYLQLRQFEQAIDHYQQALAVAQEIGDRGAEGTALGSLGCAYGTLGRIDWAIEYGKEALAIAREIGDRRGEASRLGNLGNAYRDLGQVELAIEYHQQALAIAQEIGDRRGEETCLTNLGLNYVALRQSKPVIKYLKQALAIAQEIGDRHREGNHLGSLGSIYGSLGQFAEATEYLEQALAIAQELGSRLDEGNHLAQLGVAYSVLGQLERARDCLRQSITILEEVESPRTIEVRKWLTDLDVQ